MEKLYREKLKLEEESKENDLALQGISSPKSNHEVALLKEELSTLKSQSHQEINYLVERLKATKEQADEVVQLVKDEIAAKEKEEEQR